jgi:hypothetical protein
MRIRLKSGFTASILALGATQTTWALDVRDLNLKVEPIVGVEQTQKLLPEVQSTTRLFYGARVIGGMRWISLEGEYTRAQDQENFPLTSTRSSSTSDKLKIGLRSEFAQARWFSASARLGGQAQVETAEVTVNDIKTIENTPVTYQPYAGVGARVTITPKIGFSAEVVAVFRDFPDLAQNDYQGSAGFTLAVP